MTDQRGTRGRGHAAEHARRWAVGLSAGATAVLTSFIAVGAANTADAGAGALAAPDSASVGAAPSATRAPATKPSKSDDKSSSSAATRPPTTVAPTPAPAKRQPVARSRGSR